VNPFPEVFPSDKHICRTQTLLGPRCAVLVPFNNVLCIYAEAKPGVPPLVGVQEAVHLCVLGDEAKAAQLLTAEKLYGLF